jgi:hypothetical protein
MAPQKNFKPCSYQVGEGRKGRFGENRGFIDAADQPVGKVEQI